MSGAAVLDRLTFEADRHVYRLDGFLVPSVTQILRDAGAIDFSGVALDVLDRRMALGSLVHDAIAAEVVGELDAGRLRVEQPDAWPYFESYARLARSRRLVCAFAEQRVATVKYQFAGTIDWLGTVDGVPMLLDFTIGDLWHGAKDLQTAAYLLAAFEWANEGGDPALRPWMRAHYRPGLQRAGVRLLATDQTPTIRPFANPLDTGAFLTLLSARRIVEQRRGGRLA
jgi:hypothetical protein